MRFQIGNQRDRVIAVLQKRLKRKVELKTICLGFLPPVRVEGSDLVIHQRDRFDLPPLIKIQRFIARAGVLGLLRRTKTINEVRIHGLEIHLPPQRDERTEEKERSAAHRKNIGDLLEKHPFEIREMVADNVVLGILPNDPREGLTAWNLPSLQISSLRSAQSLNLRAALRSEGRWEELTISGSFGPWNREDLKLTPLSGNYTFLNGDLSCLKGVSGILSSVGTFSGTLNKVEIVGTTRTPNFALTPANNPLNLETEFHIFVDPASGVQFAPSLVKIEATTIVVNGKMSSYPSHADGNLDLHLEVDNGRLVDVLPLGLAGASPMTGSLSFSGNLFIRPDESDLADRLSLAGQFEINDVRFCIPSVQQKLETLSERARGRNPSQRFSAPSLPWKMTGNLAIGKGILEVSDFSFAIPGATVFLEGRYLLREDLLDLRGHLVIEAKLSEMTSGFKSLLLKLVDPFFRDRGSTRIPIKVTGPRIQPSFGLNI